MIRSFLAIELSEGLQETVTEYIRELSQIPSRVKWVSTRQTHLTLKFFGSIAPEAVERISQSLSPVILGYPRFDLTLQGLGAFPNLFRPRVIWLSLGGSIQTLQGLHRVVEQALIPLGIPKEERPFQGHLTLGRNKDNQVDEGLYRRLSGWANTETAPFTVEEVTLFQSELKPAGPVHTRLRTFNLKDN